METKLMHYLPLTCFFTHPSHVSGVFIAHHQEAFTVYVQQLACALLKIKLLKLLKHINIIVNSCRHLNLLTTMFINLSNFNLLAPEFGIKLHYLQ
jgi:hypothetical protein